MNWLASLLLATIGPLCGVIVDRCGGGTGVRGGVAGGIVSYVGFGVVTWPMTDHALRTQMVNYTRVSFALVLLGCTGGLVGLGVGLFARGVMLIKGPRE